MGVMEDLVFVHFSVGYVRLLIFKFITGQGYLRELASINTFSSNLLIMLNHDKKPDKSRILQREAHPNRHHLSSIGTRTASKSPPDRKPSSTGNRIREDQISNLLLKQDQFRAGQCSEDNPRARVRALGYDDDLSFE